MIRRGSYFHATSRSRLNDDSRFSRNLEVTNQQLRTTATAGRFSDRSLPGFSLVAPCDNLGLSCPTLPLTAAPANEYPCAWVSRSDPRRANPPQDIPVI